MRVIRQLAASSCVFVGTIACLGAKDATTGDVHGYTPKHRDGFCMFDTKYSDYKVTAPECPFSV